MSRDQPRRTEADILRAVARPRSYTSIGNELWPASAVYRSTHGGPTGAQRTAACQLGKLRVKGLVEEIVDPDTLSYNSDRWRYLWRLTDAGRRRLAEDS